MLWTGIGLLIAASVEAAPVVSSHLKLLAPGGGALTTMFDFPIPVPCAPAPCTDQRVMMAKFLVDETVSDLAFEMRPVTSPITKYPVTPFTTAGGGASVAMLDNDLPAGSNQVATVRARFVAASAMAGYRMLTVLVRFDNAYDAYPAGETFRIQVTPTATSDHYYGFRVDGAIEAEAEPLITKPHLISYISDASLTNFGLFVNLPNPISIDFGEVHISLSDTYAPDEQWEFRNVGTGPLEITAVAPSPLPAGAYIIENYPAPPLTVTPMNAFQRRVVCKPTALGAIANPAVQLTTNAGNLSLNLVNGKGIELRSALVFDLSGSMLADKTGVNWTPPAEEAKIYLARLAALELTGLYNSILPKAKMGLYTYPNSAGACPSNEQHINLSVIESNLIAYSNHLNVNLGHADLIRPANSSAMTPLASGIAKAREILHPKPANTRAAVFLFGDGEHNCNADGAKPTPASWYNSADFGTTGIPFFTIPYGASGTGWLNTFQEIATKSQGFMFPADITGDMNLQTQFKKALGEALDLETLKDPASSITAGGRAVHTTCVSGSSNQLVFSVHWALKDANAVQVTIETPSHLILTPTSGSTYPGQVSYTSGTTYADYVVRGGFLKGDAGTGVWKIHVKGNKATSYVYQIFSMDRMKSQTNFNLSHVGQLAAIELKYATPNFGVAAASVSAHYRMPSASFNNYLAKTPVSRDLMNRIPDSLSRHWTLAEKKHYALANLSQQPFKAEPITGVLRTGEWDSSATEPGTSPATHGRIGMRAASLAVEPQISMAQALAAKYQGGAVDKAYSLAMPQAKFDGLYEVVVSVLGSTLRGECFEREYSFANYADILLSPVLVGKAVKWDSLRIGEFFNPDVVERLKTPVPDGFQRQVVNFTPVDEAGNYYGVGRAAEISLALQDGEALGGINDNLDGSYTQVVQFKNGGNPKVTAAVGEVSAAAVPLQEPGEGPGPMKIPLWLLVIIGLALLIAVVIVVLKRK